MKDELKRAVENEDEKGLIRYLAFSNQNKFETYNFEYIEKALIETWHSHYINLIDGKYNDAGFRSKNKK